ncbi:MAG: helix-turn-helix transcriptional regulator [Bariatricus sp.]
MFPNLEAEMARNKITQAKLAGILGITPTTLSFKLNGKSNLSLKECVEIKRNAFPDKTLDYLFATDE